MKKLLILSAAMCLLCLPSLAQVYSVNAVGYANVQLQRGFNLLANPLNAGGNTVAEVFPTAPSGAMLYSFDPQAGFSVISFDEGWLPSGQTLVPPGKGFFLRVSEASTVTFVGEVPQGALATPLAAGFSLVGSQVPQAGKLQTDLAYLPADGDQVYAYNPTSGYTVYTFDGEWLPSEPVLKVGEGIWVRKAQAGTWSRNFSVNP